MEARRRDSSKEYKAFLAMPIGEELPSLINAHLSALAKISDGALVDGEIFEAVTNDDCPNVLRVESILAIWNSILPQRRGMQDVQNDFFIRLLDGIVQHPSLPIESYLKRKADLVTIFLLRAR